MGMNKLPSAKRVQILSMLCEGSSMRSISRVADVSINTVSKLLVEAGEACLAIHDETVRNVKSSRIQCDEIWSFCYAKAEERRDREGRAGRRWRRLDVDRDRRRQQADRFLFRRRPCRRMRDRVHGRSARPRRQSASSSPPTGHRPICRPSKSAFGADVDFAQLVKLYGATSGRPGRYSPGECCGTQEIRVEGNPDLEHISTATSSARTSPCACPCAGLPG